MVYTIGVEESYNRYFKEQARPLKQGRNLKEGYPGGSVWKTEEEARAACPAGYNVYGVLAEWETDIEPVQNGRWHNLLINAELVQLDILQAN